MIVKNQIIKVEEIETENDYRLRYTMNKKHEVNVSCSFNKQKYDIIVIYI